MNYRKKEIWKSVDWVTIFLYLVLILYGWITIAGASFDFGDVGLFDLSGRPGSQLLWMGLSLGLIFVILMLERSFFDIFAYWMYGLLILLLIATIFLAPDVKGSRSWLDLGFMRLQPAEFAKFTTALALAKLMSSYAFSLSKTRDFLKALFIIFLPMVCIILEKETGSALVYLSFFLVLFREGMSGYYLLAGICAVIFFVSEMKFAEVVVGITPLGKLLVEIMILVISLFLFQTKIKSRKVLYIIWATVFGTFGIAGIVSCFIPVDFSWVSLGLLAFFVLYIIGLSIQQWVGKYLFIGAFTVISVGYLFSVDYVFNDILEPHQQVRIKVSLGLKDDPTGAGYNVNQSKIAIGSGGLWGKGFLNGTQTKLKYVPEQDTDFIFCTVGEEQGFVGSVLLLLLYGAFIIRLIVLSERQKDVFGRVYGYSVVSIFFFHLFINIGMVTGLTPVIGIPLPFFSYGGSSLWGFTILLFIFLRLDASRKDR